MPECESLQMHSSVLIGAGHYARAILYPSLLETPGTYTCCPIRHAKSPINGRPQGVLSTMAAFYLINPTQLLETCNGRRHKEPLSGLK